MPDTIADRALPGCSAVARALGAEPAGTATAMRSWLLVEEQGAWPRNALSRVLRAAWPGDQGALLGRLTVTAGLRSLLIRRPGRVAPRGGRRLVVVGGIAPTRWLESFEIDDLAELGSLDLEAVATGAGGLGQPLAGPLLLVCTHGAKDMCCAVAGRPVAAALHAAHPGRVWECSHLGGDRWAANLLVLPDGFLHGQLGVDDAERVASAAMHGRVDLARLRGRTGASQWAQAAEIAVRRATGLPGLDDVLALDETSAEDGRVTVTVQAGPDRHLVEVRREPLDACGDTRCAGLLQPSRYVVERIEAAAGAGVP